MLSRRNSQALKERLKARKEDRKNQGEERGEERGEEKGEERGTTQSGSLAVEPAGDPFGYELSRYSSSDDSLEQESESPIASSRSSEKKISASDGSDGLEDQRFVPSSISLLQEEKEEKEIPSISNSPSTPAPMQPSALRKRPTAVRARNLLATPDKDDDSWPSLTPDNSEVDAGNQRSKQLDQGTVSTTKRTKQASIVMQERDAGPQDAQMDKSTASPPARLSQARRMASKKRSKQVSIVMQERDTGLQDAQMDKSESNADARNRSSSSSLPPPSRDVLSSLEVQQSSSQMGGQEVRQSQMPLPSAQLFLFQQQPPADSLSSRSPKPPEQQHSQTSTKAPGEQSQQSLGSETPMEKTKGMRTSALKKSPTGLSSLFSRKSTGKPTGNEKQTGEEQKEPSRSRKVEKKKGWKMFDRKARKTLAMQRQAEAESSLRTDQLDLVIEPALESVPEEVTPRPAEVEEEPVKKKTEKDEWPEELGEWDSGRSHHTFSDIGSDGNEFDAIDIHGTEKMQKEAGYNQPGDLVKGDYAKRYLEERGLRTIEPEQNFRERYDNERFRDKKEVPESLISIMYKKVKEEAERLDIECESLNKNAKGEQRVFEDESVWGNMRSQAKDLENTIDKVRFRIEGMKVERDKKWSEIRTDNRNLLRMVDSMAHAQGPEPAPDVTFTQWEHIRRANSKLQLDVESMAHRAENEKMRLEENEKMILGAGWNLVKETCSHLHEQDQKLIEYDNSVEWRNKQLRDLRNRYPGMKHDIAPPEFPRTRSAWDEPTPQASWVASRIDLAKQHPNEQTSIRLKEQMDAEQEIQRLRRALTEKEYEKQQAVERAIRQERGHNAFLLDRVRHAEQAITNVSMAQKDALQQLKHPWSSTMQNIRATNYHEMASERLVQAKRQMRDNVSGMDKGSELNYSDSGFDEHFHERQGHFGRTYPLLRHNYGKSWQMSV